MVIGLRVDRVADDKRTVGLVRGAIAHMSKSNQHAIMWDSAVEVYRLGEGRL
jgi:hypothetical protein